MPAVFAFVAVGLAAGLSALEARLVLPVPDILPSRAPGARQLLASIITAMISFTALVFSTTVVTLQLAASQYSPRILRTFLQDRIVQAALGTFIATFLFAMVVLAGLPGGDVTRLPALSLTLSMALVLISGAVFIFYLNHLTTIIRVPHIIAAIGAQTRHWIDRHYPAHSEPEPPPELGPVEQVIHAESAGTLNDVDTKRLARVARRHHCTLALIPTPGDFLVAGAALVRVHRRDGKRPGPLAPADIEVAVSIGPERTPGQDVNFGFRQLADIAERALSPGISDTSTAIRAVQEMHDLLRRLATRPFTPHVVRERDGTVRVRVEPQTFDEFLSVAIDEIRYAGRDQPRVLRHLTAVLDDLATVAAPAHAPAIRRAQVATGR